MKHCVLMKVNKTKTACGIVFNAFVHLKGQKFERHNREEIESIDCISCREKLIKLTFDLNIQAVVGVHGRSVIIEL
jgi:hypothetical protein